MSELRAMIPLSDQMVLLDKAYPDSNKYHLTGGVTTMAKGTFGRAFSSHFKGAGFDIWFSNYHIDQPTDFILNYPPPLFLLHIPWVNESGIIYGDAGESNSGVQQFDIYCSPGGNLVLTFPGATDYQVFAIVFSPDFLKEFAKHCDKLQAVLDKADAGRTAQMLETRQFLSPDMMHVIYKMINFKGKEALASLYFSGLVQELLLLVCIRVNLLSDQPTVPAIDLAQAEKARKIITGDFEAFHTVEELAAKVGTTKHKLQKAFKYLYGQTVAEFSREARLEKGHQLLIQTTYPLRVVCEMVGYPDPSNFSVAFKKQYGFWPGEIQKNKKE